MTRGILDTSGRGIVLEEKQLDNGLILKTTFTRWANGADGELHTWIYEKCKPYMGLGGPRHTIDYGSATSKIKYNEYEIPERHNKKVEKLLRGLN
jgi:hypothetical protein